MDAYLTKNVRSTDLFSSLALEPEITTCNQVYGHRE